MTWSLFRWVWQPEGPLHVGIPPAGSLNRTRLYVPARAVWGALTAELSRREALSSQQPQYQAVGASLQDVYRFTYLYPAERTESGWRAWLPTYRKGVGAAWHREDDQMAVASDRALRRRLLFTRPGTSIDASTDAADDGSLRETECIETRWRGERSQDAGPVAMVGYVFIRTKKAKDKYPPERRRINDVDTLFVGGDTRYGLGRLRRVGFDLFAEGEAFGATVTLDGSAPQVARTAVLAHASAETALSGALELVGGWDRGTIRSVSQQALLWQPGSTATTPVHWSIEADGLWRGTT